MADHDLETTKVNKGQLIYLAVEHGLLAFTASGAKGRKEAKEWAKASDDRYVIVSKVKDFFA